MGSFSWTRAESTTRRSNLTYGDKYKILVPKEFGGGYIKDIYFDYGHVFDLATDRRYMEAAMSGYYQYYRPDGSIFDCYGLGASGRYCDLYGILAYWNGCSDMDYEGDTYPKLMEDILVHGKTHEQSNRCKGIDIGCYMDQIDALKYPLKLVSVSYGGTYEDCKGRSYGDPNQGFGKYNWDHRDYEKYLEKLDDVETEDVHIEFPSCQSEESSNISDDDLWLKLGKLIHEITSLQNKHHDKASLMQTYDLLLDSVNKYDLMLYRMEES